MGKRALTRVHADGLFGGVALSIFAELQVVDVVKVLAQMPVQINQCKSEMQ